MADACPSLLDRALRRVPSGGNGGTTQGPRRWAGCLKDTSDRNDLHALLGFIQPLKGNETQIAQIIAEIQNVFNLREVSAGVRSNQG